MKKTFKVAAVSSNTNSFGLQGMVLIAKDGEAWQVGANYINVLKQGDTVDLDTSNTGCFANHSWEIPERLPKAPPKVVNEAWNKTQAQNV